MKIAEPNWRQLLVETHRRWIETRDPKDGDRFAVVVLAAASASRKALTTTAEPKP